MSDLVKRLRDEADGPSEPKFISGKTLREAADRIEALEAENERLGWALTLAANRLHRLVLDQPMGSRSRDEVSEWTAEARAALPHP